MSTPAQALAPSQPGAIAEALSGPRVLRLKLFQQFHIRLTLIYGAVVLAGLGAMAVAFYIGGVNIAMKGVRSRLRGTAIAIARGIAAEQVSELRAPADADKPAHKELIEDFAAVCAAEPDVLSIYVLVPEPQQPGMFHFAVDYVAPGKRSAPAAFIGQLYDARNQPTLLRGMKELAVEDAPASDEWGETLSGYAPVVDLQDRPVALVGVDTEARALRAMKQHVLLVAASLFVGVAILLSGAALVVARAVREPLGRIIEATSAIAAGDYQTRARLERQDEFGILGRHFDSMAQGLEERERIRSTFGRYVSEDVARRILSSTDAARLGGEVREVTVLFSDLRSYSTISESLQPTEVVEFLNSYLAEMNEQVDKHGGVIIEFLGDAILAVFGAPNDLPDHATRAVRCALDMRARLAVFNERMNAEGRAPWRKKGMERLGQRIGIHTGSVLAGNLGSRTRVKYAVIGDAVNVASRCEGLNKSLGTEILCTVATRDLLPADLQQGLTDKGAHPVKGREQLVQVFSA